MTLEQARAYAELRIEEMEAGERILIMKKGDDFIATTDYKTYKNEGYEVYEALYK